MILEDNVKYYCSFQVVRLIGEKIKYNPTFKVVR